LQPERKAGSIPSIIFFFIDLISLIGKVQQHAE